MARRSRIFADVKAVALDGYGTVIDFTEPDFIVTMAEVAAAQGFNVDAADLWQRFLKASYDMRAEHHHDPVYTRYDEAWARQFEVCFAQLGIEADAWKAAEHLRERLATAPAFEEARGFVEELRRHYPVAMVSNADDDFLTRCLERNKLEFDVILTSEQAGAIKPNREIFDKAAERLQIPNAHIVYAGDNPIPDVLGPVRAGMKAVWVNRFGHRKPRGVPQPHLRVKSLTELLPKLAPPVG